MTTAIIGLVGVLVGGLINGFAAAVAERRRDGRACRATSRLLGRELTGALYGVREWRRCNHVPDQLRDDVLRFPAWKQYHEVAARTLPPDAWEAVSDAYLLLYTVRTRDDFTGDLTASACTHLRRSEIAIAAAIEGLRPLAGSAIARPGSNLVDHDEPSTGDALRDYS